MANKNDLFIKLRENKINDVISFINNNTTLDYNIKDDAGTYLIFYIVAVNNIQLLKSILQTNIKIDLYDSDGRTILYIPIKYGYVDVIKELLHYSNITVGIPIHLLTDDIGNIAIHYTIAFKNTECFNLLLPISNITITDVDGNNALHHAVLHNSLEYVTKIYNRDNNTDIQNSSGESPLHIACRLSLTQIANFLLSQKTNVNVQEFNLQSTPLHYACYSGNEHIVSMLLDHNADVNVQDFDGNTPLHYCVMYDKFNIIKILFTHKTSLSKINVNLYNINLMVPLHIVLDSLPKNLHMYIDLLLQKTNLNFQNKLGTTCLHELCRLSIWKKYTEQLKTKKLDIVIKNGDKMRPIDYINTDSRDIFIDIVVSSYYNTLIATGNIWSLKWENECKNDTVQCKQMIKEKILDIIKNNSTSCNDKTYPIKSTKMKCILPMDTYEDGIVNTMEGTTLDILCGLIYLIKKHKNTKMPFNEISFTDSTKCNFYAKHHFINISHLNCMLEKYFVTWYKNILDIDNSIQNILLQLINSPKTEFIILFAKLIQPSGSSHANIILYSKSLNEIERFDPFGSGFDDTFDDKLEKYFRSVIPNVSYISPRKYMTIVGFQKIDITESRNEYIGDPDGFCVAWSIWYADMRIQFSGIPRTKLIKYIMTQIGEKQLKYRSIIRNYSRNITKIRDNILNSANIDINKYINEDYDNETSNAIIDLINTSVHE